MKSKKRDKSKNKSRKKRGGNVLEPVIARQINEHIKSNVALKNAEVTNIVPKELVSPPDKSLTQLKLEKKLKECHEDLEKINKKLKNETEINDNANILKITPDELKIKLERLRENLENECAKIYKRLYKVVIK
jgi:hypothetical protein